MTLALIMPGVMRLLSHYIVPIHPVIRRSYQLTAWLGVASALFYAHTNYIFQFLYLGAFLTAELNLALVIGIQTSHNLEFVMSLAMGSLLFTPYMFIAVIGYVLMEIIWRSLQLVSSTRSYMLKGAILAIHVFLGLYISWGQIDRSSLSSAVSIVWLASYCYGGLLLLEILNYRKELK